MLSSNKDTNKNLKDPERNPLASYGAGSDNMSIITISYTKTHKLITALYMVTDIIDKEEPIRNKLRILGAEIISDMHNTTLARTVLASVDSRIAETVSFLNIASAMNFISEMNCSILKKEFLELKGSIQEYVDMKPTWLAEFFKDSPLEGWSKTGVDKSIPPPPKGYSSRGELNSKGHHPIGHTRIGVQKGSTLMQALSDKITDVGRQEFGRPTSESSKAKDFDMLKKQRRDEITNIIKANSNSATITDIKTRAVGALTSCSEKTLQRELMSMTKDGVLNKTGEKRWTQYFLK